MQVDAGSNSSGEVYREPTSLTKLPLDILKGVFRWIRKQSIDACMLRLSCSSLKWILKQYMGWDNKIDVHMPFNHQLDQIDHLLPPFTQEVIIPLKLTSLRHGNIANFKRIPKVAITDTILRQYLEQPITHGYPACLKSVLDMYKSAATQSLYDDMLALSCWYGHLDTVELLISVGADVTSNDNLALVHAASEGKMDIVMRLCIHGANIHSQRVAHAASGKGHLNVLVFLRALGANVASERNTLVTACINGRLDVVKFLLSVRQPTNAIDDYAPLQHASRYGYLDIVKYLHLHGIFKPGSSFGSAVVDASMFGYVEIVKFFHAAGVDVLARSDAAFRSACAQGHLEVVVFLVSVGADIHACEDYAIRNACDGGHAVVAKYLYSYGAPVIMPEHLLITAAREGHFALLQFYHSIEPITAYPKLLSNASKSGNVELVEWLLFIGFDIHYDNDLAVQIASEYDCLEVVKFLHSMGANIRADNDAALRRASHFGNLKVVVFLRSVGATISAQALDALHVTDKMVVSGVARFLRSIVKADENRLIDYTSDSRTDDLVF